MSQRIRIYRHLTEHILMMDSDNGWTMMDALDDWDGMNGMDGVDWDGMNSLDQWSVVDDWGSMDCVHNWGSMDGLDQWSVVDDWSMVDNWLDNGLQDWSAVYNMAVRIKYKTEL